MLYEATLWFGHVRVRVAFVPELVTLKLGADGVAGVAAERMLVYGPVAPFEN
jgi:hypothetical protein